MDYETAVEAYALATENDIDNALYYFCKAKALETRSKLRQSEANLEGFRQDINLAKGAYKEAYTLVKEERFGDMPYALKKTLERMFEDFAPIDEAIERLKKKAMSSGNITNKQLLEKLQLAAHMVFW